MSGGAGKAGGSSSGEGSNGGAAGNGGLKVWVVNTHLDHEHTDNRQRQVCTCSALCAVGPTGARLLGS